MRLDAYRISVAAGFAALAAMPVYAALADQPFYLDLFTRVMVFGLAALSLDLILGYGGLVSFGHAAYLGIGSYAVGILAFYGITDGFVQFGVAILASALVAAFIGAISLRTTGVSFVMITLAFAQMLYFLAISLNVFGGDDGMSITQHSDFGPFVDLANPTILYYVVFAVLAVAFVGAQFMVDSRFGMVLRGAKSNGRRMTAIGFPIFRYRLAAFVISAAMCGVAGALLANQLLFVSPAIMHWARSGEIIIMVILGGIGSLFGAILGAAVYVLLEHELSALTEHWLIILGPLLILVVLFAKRGVFGLIARAPRGRAVAEAILAIEGLVKRFGGLVATDGLALDVREGEVHAVIGPNGAGKTTLVAQIAGELRPDAGTIRFLGEDLTALPAYRRSLRGLARSFQITSVFQEFTALDNVAFAVQAHQGHSFRFWRAARRDPALREPARAMLDQVGLGPRADIVAAHLAHGEKRALEIAMALATRPRLLLLDEPMAGMGSEDSARMVRMLARLKGSVTILLIEHDMDAVFALADRITVLVYGRAIASGAPAEIRDDPAVREAYLGGDDAAAAV